MTKEDIIGKLKDNIKYLSLLAVVILGFLLIFLYKGKNQNASLETNNLFSQNEVSSVEQISSHTSSKESSDFIMVDIKGAVKKAGLYKVKSDYRLDDVIRLAGGMTEEADSKSVNLAQKLVDEMVIYVASKGEGVDLTSKETVQTTGGESSAKVNINQADLTELQTLSGIGAKRAQDIIDYREANGNFKTVDELSKISGIGPKSLEKLRDSISLD